jgi:hypothetical protein
MKVTDKRLVRLEAKMVAYENAAEFIRSHGEEGGIEQNEWCVPVDVYLQEAAKVAKRLNKVADKIRAQINSQAK